MARVTLVVNDVGAGSETFLRSLETILVDLGHHLTVHALSGELPSVAPTSSATSLSAALPPRRSAPFAVCVARLVVRHGDAAREAVARAVTAFGRSARALRAAALAAPLLVTEPDVVHLGFSGIAVSLRDALDLLDPATRIVISCRGSGELVQPVVDPSVRPVLAQVLGRADAVHVVSVAVGSVVAGLGAPPDRIHLIRPAIDPARFRRRCPRRPVGDPVRLVTVGRLHWVKGIDTQVDAVHLLARQGRATDLTVVGEGPERPALTFRAAELGVEDRIHLIGQRPPDEVRDLVEAADAFLLTSLSEGTSNAVLEAMALEVPVISSAVGGMPEVIEDGVDGMLVPAGDPGTLADAVERMFDQDGLARKLADAGRHKVLGGYTLDRQRDDVRTMYSAVLR